MNRPEGFKIAIIKVKFCYWIFGQIEINLYLSFTLSFYKTWLKSHTFCMLQVHIQDFEVNMS